MECLEIDERAPNRILWRTGLVGGSANRTGPPPPPFRGRADRGPAIRRVKPASGPRRADMTTDHASACQPRLDETADAPCRGTRPRSMESSQHFPACLPLLASLSCLAGADRSANPDRSRAVAELFQVSPAECICFDHDCIQKIAKLNIAKLNADRKRREPNGLP